MAINHFVFFAAAITVALLPTLAAHASSVESMSLEIFKNGDERYWEVSVACANATESWSMQRPIDSDQWCTTTSPQLCGENKFILSSQVCDSVVGDTMPIKQNNRTTTATATGPQSVTTKSQANADRYELMQEQMQIEQQRIQIQQRRLALQRKELQLKRQQLGN